MVALIEMSVSHLKVSFCVPAIALKFDSETRDSWGISVLSLYRVKI